MTPIPESSRIELLDARSTNKQAVVNATADAYVGYRPGQPIGEYRLFSVVDVGALLGCSDVTAAKIMRESGRCKQIHHRLYIFEDDLEAFLRTGVA